MHRIELFSDYNRDDLEKSVNSWLYRIEKDHDIVQICFHEPVYHPRHQEFFHSLSIHFKKKDNDTN